MDLYNKEIIEEISREVDEELKDGIPEELNNKVIKIMKLSEERRKLQENNVISTNVNNIKDIIVAMMHTNRQGESKILKRCTLPITGVNCVKKIVTNLAVLEVTQNGFKLLERASGVSVEEIKTVTEADLIIEGEIPEMKL